MAEKNIRNLGIYGLIRQAEVDDALTPDGVLTDVINFHFDRKGASTVRLGVSALGSTISAGNPALGLWNVQNSTLIVSFVFSGSMRISEWSGSAWNTLYTGTGGSTTTRFVDFAGRTVFFSGLERSAVAWNGTGLDLINATIENSGNPMNLQQLWYVNGNTNAGYIRPKYGEVYKSRIYFAGDSVNPDRLYFSSVITSGGNITWTPSTDFIDINPNDGENIIALKRYSLELLIFKPNYIYRFRTSSLDPDPLIRVGTRNQESIVEGKRGLYFHHDTGIYRYAGGYPIEISRPISDLINNISYSNYSNVAAWKDDDHLYWSVGNIPIVERRGITTTYANAVLRYTESSDLWTLYSYSTGIRQGMAYNSGSAISRVIGTNNGIVATVNSTNADISGEPISYLMITKWYDLNSPHILKLINNIVALSDRAQAMRVMVQLDTDEEWKELGQLTSFSTSFLRQFEFKRIRFKVAGVTTFNPPPVFLGLIIPSIVARG